MLEYSVSVRELAEFCFRSGDIDYRFTPSPTAVEGIEGHRQVYQRRPASYQSEYSVEHCVIVRTEFSLTVRGRADGYDPELHYVEEIKTCRVEVSAIPSSVTAVHWAQVRLYAALVCAREADRDSLGLQLTYFNVESGEEYPCLESETRGSLLGFLAQTLDKYCDWMSVVHGARLARDASIAVLAFPHPDFRRGQREMAENVYKCATQGGQLLLQAPTGIGKTAAVLYPAIKALEQGKHDVLCYVTAKTVGSRAAETALAQLAGGGLQLHSLTLTAKERVCFSPGKACHGADCRFARGYYDRLPAARAAAFSEHRQLSREVLESVARRFEVCPYQLASDLLPWMDLCIGDIHYVYSFFARVGAVMEARRKRWSVLLDEAHNLPDRARGMYSAALRKRDLMVARRDCDGAVRKALDACNRMLLELQKQEWEAPEYHAMEAPPPALKGRLQKLAAAVAERSNRDVAWLQARPVLRDFYFAVLQFLRVLEHSDVDYRFELRRNSRDQRSLSHDQSLSLHLNCLDPARLLRPRQQAPHSVTAFSATVSPPGWVNPAIGFDQRAVYLALPSPFAAEQYQVTINTEIDTRFRARRRSLPTLVAAIQDWLQTVAGNCIVYFPAYQYMADALQQLQPGLAQRRVFVQAREQDDAGRARLLAELQERRDVVAFCILGGVFGEGIDLPGEELSSVVIVGVGLPQVNRETRSLRNYYQASTGEGFAHAYLYPGMQKVNQALGRVIRSSSDRGRALLIDRRYRDPAYRELLPPWWEYRFQ
ncbi:MAG: ATP-dependent DNA helicase [Gammaproteobacteria bacterium]|nr:ATP-dependent DNA helicase [Gammaproteobacteria bacterium]